MKMTNKEVNRAEQHADDFFQDMTGEDLAIVGLTILFIAGGFIIDIAEDRESAMEGLESFMADIEAAINEAYPSIN